MNDDYNWVLGDSWITISTSGYDYPYFDLSNVTVTRSYHCPICNKFAKKQGDVIVCEHCLKRSEI